MIEGYAAPYAATIRKAMKQLDARTYKAHNPPSEALRREEKTYNSYRLVFTSSNVYAQKEIKRILAECGMIPRVVNIFTKDNGIFEADRIYECRIEIPVKVLTKKLAPRTLARALKASDKAAEKFAVRFN
jgi:hypothetical protein